MTLVNHVLKLLLPSVSCISLLKQWFPIVGARVIACDEMMSHSKERTDFIMYMLTCMLHEWNTSTVNEKMYMLMP